MIRWTCLLRFIVFLAFVWLLAPSSRAAEGDPDSTFGGGIAHTGLSGDFDAHVATAIQPDGKILMALRGGSAVGYSICALRYDTHGLPDSTFGTDGIACTGVSSSSDSDVDVVVSSFGNIYLAGRESSGEVFVTRFDSTGVLTGVAQSGISCVPYASVAITFDSGDLVVAGHDSATGDNFVARFTWALALASSFGTGGVAHTGRSAFQSAGVDLTVQPDGKILLAGIDASVAQHFVARFDVMGALDPTFAPGVGVWGIARTGLTAFDSEVAVALAPDGDIVLAGQDVDRAEDFLARFTAGGSLDVGFGNAGIAYAGPWSSDVSGVDMAMQPDGRIVLAGHDRSWSRDFVVRFDSSGTLDPGFWTSGLAHTGTFSRYESLVSLDVQADGGIVLAGHDGIADVHFLVRFDPEGRLDPEFGTARIGFTHVGVISSRRSDVAVAIGTAGSVILAGNGGSGDEHFVMRIDPGSGVLDDTFGVDGVAFTGFQSGDLSGVDVAARVDGKFLLAGVDLSWRGFVACFDSTGGLDPSFGTAGVARTAGVSVEYDTGVGVVLQPDGKLVFAGKGSSPPQNFVTRFDATGAVDSGFGTNGIAHTGLLSDLGARVAVELQSDGKIVVAGMDQAVGNHYVARFDATGALDLAFGSFGIRYTGLYGESVSKVALAIQADGKILLAGHDDSAHENFVARLDGTGYLDSSFGVSGIAHTGIYGANDSDVDVAAQADGKVLLSGNDSSNQFVVRFDSLGVLDGSFGSGGIAYGGPHSVYGSGIALAIQPNGRVVMAGYDTMEDQDFVACFLGTPGIGTSAPVRTVREGLSAGPVRPNPFRETAAVPYALPAPGHARMAVYDIGGRLVAILVDGPHPAGGHTARWTGRDRSGEPVAAGVYFVRLEVSGETRTRKMVRVKE